MSPDPSHGERYVKIPLTPHPRRKDLSDKVGETATPDSQKSTLDQVKESATGTADKVAAEVQPGESDVSLFAGGVLGRLSVLTREGRGRQIDLPASFRYS